MSRKPARGERPKLDRERRLELYRYLRANRLVEERLTTLYRQGHITGGLFRSLGQEATSVGAAAALGPRDVLAPMIRNLGSLLVRGVKPRDLFAQYLARGESPTQGKDNVVHFGTVDGQGHFAMDERGGLVSCISPLGNLVAVLGGMALGGRLQGLDTVCMTFAGDGSISTGEFHEGMSLVCAQRLPVVVVIENNGWAYSTPTSRQSLLVDLADRALAYGCPGEVVDGQDLEAVLEVSSRAVSRARNGEGPTVIEAKTYRMLGHAQHDDQRYVPEAELEAWAARDPIALYSARLIEAKVATAKRLEEIDTELARDIDIEAEAALAMAPPQPGVALEGVYNEPAADLWIRHSREGGFAPPDPAA